MEMLMMLLFVGVVTIYFCNVNSSCSSQESLWYWFRYNLSIIFFFDYCEHVVRCILFVHRHEHISTYWKMFTSGI